VSRSKELAKKFWAGIVVLSAWVGILMLPKDIPDLREVYGVPVGWLMSTPRETALIILSGLLVLWIIWIDVRPAVRRWWKERNQSPLAVSFSPTFMDVIGNELVFHNPLRIRNSSPLLSFDGVEVHLVSVSRMQPQRGGTHSINQRLIERNSKSPSFDLAPDMPRDVFFFRRSVNSEKGHAVKIGPLELANGQQLSYGPGLYKIDIAVYGRGAQPAFESLAVGLDESGAIMHGRWRDDEPWPFVVNPNAAPSTQPQPSTE
jgi:hypothetical protein